MWSNIESKNYLFHFHPNSLAHKELYKIIELLNITKNGWLTSYSYLRESEGFTSAVRTVR